MREGEKIIAGIRLTGFGLNQSLNGLAADWTSRPEGETYVIDSSGTMLTPSRFNARLQFDSAEGKATSDTISPAASIRLRDPGKEILPEAIAKSDTQTWPPTLPASQIASGNSGVNVSGYRNYLGNQVVGAWRWLEDSKLGLVVEQDYSFTYATAATVRNTLLGMSGLFSLGLLAMAIAGATPGLLNNSLRDTAEAGPYQVQELLGEGGMGRVYLAEHALLCRQSAIKVLTNGSSDLSVIARFEREVQLASQLTHPNTIQIYDFGRNREGSFYYSMEYVNGAHLGQLVEYCGAIEPGRCIYILKQLCRALKEAHVAGVVHRDIKPQNIMVCNRGGEPDFLKLFDYGLVKSFAPGISQSSSQTKIVVGTPRFMAPERLNSPWLADPRVDVYSVGALAYFLLTGTLPTLVTPGDGVDGGQPGIETLDLPAAIVDFGGLLSVCIAVEPSSRPSNMGSLLRELETLSSKFPWTREDSVAWWEEHESRLLSLVHSKRKKLQAAIEQSAHGNH